MQEREYSADQNAQATPGSALRRARREKSLSVEDVSEATKISVKNIRAIEAAAFEQLPADTFVRGLVTIYGNYLGLDGGRLAAEFLAARKKLPSGGRPQNLTLKKVPPSTLAPKKLAEPAQISSATLALILFCLILISFSGFCLYTSWNPLAFLTSQTDTMQASIQKIFAGLVGDSETAETQQAQEVEQAKAPGQATERPSAPEQNKPAGYHVGVHFLKNSTVTIVTDDQEPIRKEYKSGQIIELTADKQIKLIFSVPEAATLTLNGRPLSFPTAADDSLPTLLIPDDLPDQ